MVTSLKFRVNHWHYLFIHESLCLHEHYKKTENLLSFCAKTRKPIVTMASISPHPLMSLQPVPPLPCFHPLKNHASPPNLPTQNATLPEWHAMVTKTTFQQTPKEHSHHQNLNYGYGYECDCVIIIAITIVI